MSIWGIIGYRIITTINPSKPKIENQYFDVAFNPKNNTKVDTFSIQTVNRDPFLGTLLVSNKTRISKKNTSKVKVNWIPVTYHGSISKQDAKNKVFIISIDGKQYPMKVGQTVNEVRLIRGYTNAVLVSYKGERKAIKKT